MMKSVYSCLCSDAVNGAEARFAAAQVLEKEREAIFTERKAHNLSKIDTGILRWKPSIHWKKDRGKDVESAPWYRLGLQYNEGEGARINDHHLTLEEKRKARESNA